MTAQLPKKLVYIAGPLMGAHAWGIHENIYRAAQIGFEVAKLGAYPVIPHTNTGSVFMGTMDAEFWYAGTLELMRRCDALVMVPGWEKSTGAAAEAKEASERGMPIFEFSNRSVAPEIYTVLDGMRTSLADWIRKTP